MARITRTVWRRARLFGEGTLPRLPPKVLLRRSLEGILLTAGMAFVFYRSFWALLGGVVILPLYLQQSRRRWLREYTSNLQQQFVSLLQMVSGSLLAGYSMENAWRRGEEELALLYGEAAELTLQMRRMNQRLAVNEPLEKIIADFAARSGVEEIIYFSEVFRYAKRSGGNLTEIIRTVTGRMQEKAEVLAEIETSISAKKMEMRMMNLLLPGVILFVTVSSPSYVEILYHQLLGITVMSGCLAGYLVCMYWAEKLMDIPL